MTGKGAARPRLWIVAGPNGSGKSTAYGHSDLAEFDGSVWIINPDLLTVRIRDIEKLGQREANLAAVQRIEAWLYASIDTHQTIGVETVLSTDKYRALVERAIARGFDIRLIYVYLETADLQIERIRLRVAKGGHPVPDDKVRERRQRSFDQFSWFFAQANFARVYDNSGAVPELVAAKDGDEARISGRMIADLRERLVPSR